VKKRATTVRPLSDSDTKRQEDIAYWLSRPPGERIAEVERLRRELYGELPRLDKSVYRIIRREE